MTAQPCLWCDGPFTPRTTGGKPQRFCSERCRRDLDSGCRAWAEQAVSSGLLPVSALKDALKQRARSSEAHSGPNATQTPSKGSRESWTPPAPRHVTP